MTLSDKIKAALEESDIKDGINREQNINNLPDELRIVYSYALQVVTAPIDATKTQKIPYNILDAINEAEKGNYKPLGDIQEELIRYSMGL